MSGAFRIQAFFFLLYIPTFSELPACLRAVRLKVVSDPFYTFFVYWSFYFLFPLMDCERHSLNLDLHRAALNGDDEAVRCALRDGADINSLDAAGRTTIMCAVAGEQYASFPFLFIPIDLTVN